MTLAAEVRPARPQHRAPRQGRECFSQTALRLREARGYPLATEARGGKGGAGDDREVDTSGRPTLIAPLKTPRIGRRGEFGDSRHVKFYLTGSKGLSLLCMCGRCNLSTLRSIQSTEYAHMNNIQVIKRVAEGLLAVAATGVSVLVFQFAMLAG
jgi:hypothetical protein